MAKLAAPSRTIIWAMTFMLSKVSMGNYLFEEKVLKKILVEEELMDEGRRKIPRVKGRR